jgi:hypothetical protein
VFFGGEAVRNIEWQHRTKDGTTKWVLCRTFPLIDTDGQVVGAISANIDITERKAQEQLIEAQRDELEAQNDQLQQITARLAEANARLERIAHTDGLTGLINHRSFRDRLGREFLLCAAARATSVDRGARCRPLQAVQRHLRTPGGRRGTASGCQYATSVRRQPALCGTLRG